MNSEEIALLSRGMQRWNKWVRKGVEKYAENLSW